MKGVIESYKKIVIQIATPNSVGTGFYLGAYGLIVTNEHVIRGNPEVVIDGLSIQKQIAKVLFTDPKLDLAFLKAPEDIDAQAVSLFAGSIKEGAGVIAIGHPFGLKYTATSGIISNAKHEHEETRFYQHDAALNPGNSGGPLLNEAGEIIGVNTFIIQEGNNIGFSLPVSYLETALESYKALQGQVATKCGSCTNIVQEQDAEDKYCPHCGAQIEMPSMAEAYEAVGISKTVEDMLITLGHNVMLSRKGPNSWEIREGSARIHISYYEKMGYLYADSHLAILPKQNIKPIYEYLLRENFKVEGLTFSIKGNEIVLSLLIYDKYLNVETALDLFQHLFKKSDDYDNVLVEKFGALWKHKDSNDLESMDVEFVN